MNKKQCINEIIAEYTAKANAQKTTIALKLAALRKNDESFAGLENDVSALRIEYARQKANGAADPVLTARLQTAEKIFAEYMETHDIAIQPKCHCKKCEDTGWANGKLCSCVRQRLQEKITEASGISSILKDFNDSGTDFFPENLRENREKIYRLMRDYCKKFPNAQYRNVFITGSVGSGKSHLISCMANEVLKKSETVQFLTSFAFGNQMLKANFAPIDERESLISPLLETDLLILDDLGAEPVLNNITIEYLYLVLNERLIIGKNTVLTTNLSPADFLARYGSRVFSRAMDKKSTYIAYMDGPDLRLNASGATAK